MVFIQGALLHHQTNIIPIIFFVIIPEKQIFAIGVVIHPGMIATIIGLGQILEGNGKTGFSRTVEGIDEDNILVQIVNCLGDTDDILAHPFTLS